MSSPDNELNLHLATEDASDAKNERADELIQEWMKNPSTVAEWISAVLDEQSQARDDFVALLAEAITVDDYDRCKEALGEALDLIETHVMYEMRGDALAELDHPAQPQDEVDLI